jgi:DNA-binding transcriptional LysR family regulator
MWEHVELREIRAFLAVSDELHFRRAAERLGISPARVSQLIRALEVKLEATLLQRTSRRVQLTAHGSRLRSQLAPLHEDLADTLRRAYVQHDSINGRLRLGVYLSAGGTRLIDVVRAFEAAYPDCEVEMRSIPWNDTLGALLAGELDVLAIRLPIRHPEIVVGPLLCTDERVLAVARNHPLARRRSVTLEDVADYRVAQLNLQPPELATDVVPRAAPSGRPIKRLEPPVSHHADLTPLIALGKIVHPTGPNFAKHFGHPDIVYVPLHGLPRSRTALAWRNDNSDIRVTTLARIANELPVEHRQLRAARPS